MFVMFMLLLVGRLRFNNQKLHSICRILFSLTLAFSLVYWPARLVQAQVQMAKWIERPFGEMYFCSTENITYGDNTLRMCRTRVARDMFSFIAGFLVVVELVFAAVVGEIGIH
ncbi:hypothetical protein BG000_007418 [Podila horticola]|nr:hypothetical protein BG000_007418 [Podila horticola]